MREQIQTLIVDDDDGIRFFLAKVLRGEEHAVVTASSGEEALEYLRDTTFDLAVLDLMLGARIDGLRILQAIRWRWPNMATIILTGHGTLDSAMEAIREGVDAYLLKPVKPDEMRRIANEVLKKRQQKQEEKPLPVSESENPTVLKRGRFSVDLQEKRIEADGHVLDLKTFEYELLVFLMKNDDRPVSPTELVKIVRGFECEHVQEARDVIKWYIYNLRRKVEPKPSVPRHILNVRGVGYIFKT